MPTLSSRKKLDAERAARAKLLVPENISTHGELRAATAMVLAGGSAVRNLEANSTRMAYAASLLDGLCDREVGRYWRAMLLLKGGEDYCGRNVQAIAGSGRGQTVFVFADGSGSMRTLGGHYLSKYIGAIKDEVRALLANGAEVFVFPFGQQLGGSECIPGAEFANPSYNIGFHRMTYIQPSHKTMRRLMLDRPGGSFTCFYFTDGGLNDAGRGEAIAGVDQAQIYVIASNDEYSQVRTSHIRNLESQLPGATVVVKNLGRYPQGLDDHVCGKIAGAVVSTPGLAALHGLVFPEIALDPDVAGELIERGGKFMAFYRDLFKGALAAARDSIVNFVESPYAIALKTLSRAKRVAERLAEECTDADRLVGIDALFAAAKELQDTLGTLKDVACKSLEASGAMARRDAFEKKFVELTQFDHSEELLERVGEFSEKLVVGGKHDDETVRLVLNAIRTCHTADPTTLSLIVGQVLKLRVVPTTGAEKLVVPVTADPAKAHLTLMLLPQLVGRFTLTRTVVTRLAILVRAGAASFDDPRVGRIFGAVLDTMSAGVRAAITTTAASAIDNRAPGWMRAYTAVFGPESFGDLLKCVAPASAAKYSPCDAAAEAYRVARPPCPDVDDPAAYGIVVDPSRRLRRRDVAVETLLDLDRTKHAGRSDCMFVPLFGPGDVPVIEGGEPVWVANRNISRRVGDMIGSGGPSPIALVRQALARNGAKSDAAEVFVENLHEAAHSLGLGLTAATPDALRDNATVLRPVMLAFPARYTAHVAKATGDEIFASACHMVAHELPEMAAPLFAAAEIGLKDLRLMATNTALEAIDAQCHANNAGGGGGGGGGGAGGGGGGGAVTTLDPRLAGAVAEYAATLRGAITRTQTLSPLPPVDPAVFFAGEGVAPPHTVRVAGLAALLDCGLCVVCVTEKISARFRPCGHACACADCAAGWMTINPTCPMCRAPVSHVEA